MRFPTNKTLGTITVYGAFASITGVMYMRYKIEDRVRNAPYFRLALHTLRQHKGAVSLLGEPIKELGFDLADEKKNFCDGQVAKLEVKVRGPKDKGKMFFLAQNSLEDGWFIKRLELEVHLQPDKRFLIKTSAADLTSPSN